MLYLQSFGQHTRVYFYVVAMGVDLQPVKPAQKNTHLQRFRGKNGLIRYYRQSARVPIDQTLKTTHVRGITTGIKV
jgi:hypothetical protein